MNTDAQAAQAHYEAGLDHYAARRFEEALREFEHAKRLEPGEVFFRTWVAEALGCCRRGCLPAGVATSSVDHALPTSKLTALRKHSS